MNEHDPNSVRAHVDGELSRAESERLEAEAATNEDLRRRIEFERTLRDRVGAVLRATSPSAGDDLAERVQAAVRAAPRLVGADETNDIPAEPATTGWRWLRGPARANVFAVAASLLLVAGAILFGVLGRPIDSLRPVSNGIAAVTADFVSGEHGRCSLEPDALDRKACWRGRQAKAALEQHLGVAITVPDLSRYGFELIGAGPCGMPGVDVSGHLVYRLPAGAPDGCRNTLLSIFVAPVQGALTGDQLPSPWEWLLAGEPPACSKRVAWTTDGSAAYFIVCCDDRLLGDLTEIVSGAAR